MRSVLKDMANELLSKQEKSVFNEDYPGEKFDATNRDLDVCLYNVNNAEFAITQNEKERLINWLLDLLKYHNGEANSFNDLGKEGTLFECVVEKVFVNAKKDSLVYWGESKASLGINANGFAEFKIEFSDTSFAQQNPLPVVAKRDLTTDDDVIRFLLSGGEGNRAENYEHYVDTILLTNSNPVKIRTALISALKSTWANNFYGQTSSVASNLAKTAAELVKGHVFISDTIGSDFLGIFSQEVFHNKSIVKYAQSGWFKHGYCGSNLSKTIDNVYLSLDPSILTLAGRYFLKLTWHSYVFAMEHEKQIHEITAVHGGMSALHFPPQFIAFNNGGNLHIRAQLVEDAQRHLISKFATSERTRQLLKECNEAYLFKMIRCIFDSVSDLDCSETYVKLASDFWASVLVNMAERFHRLPSASFIQTRSINGQILFGNVLDVNLAANIAEEALKFSNLTKNLKRRIHQTEFIKSLLNDAQRNPQYYQSTSSTHVRSKARLNTIFTEERVYYRGWETYFIEQFSEKYSSPSAKSSSKKNPKKLFVSSIFYKEFDASIPCVKIYIEYYKNGLKGIMTVKPIKDNASTLPAELAPVKSEVDLLLPTSAGSKFSQQLIERHPLFAAVIGFNTSLNAEAIRAGEVQDEFMPISKGGLNFLQINRLVESISLNGCNIDGLIPVVIKAAKNPFMITPAGKSILDTIVKHRNPTVIKCAYQTYVEMGADKSFLDRSLEAALATYDIEVVFQALKYSSDISEDQIATINAWGSNKTLEFESELMAIMMRSRIKSRRHCAAEMPKESRKKLIDVL